MLSDADGRVQPEPDKSNPKPSHPDKLRFLIAQGRVVFIIEKLPNDMGTMIGIIEVSP